MEHFTTSFEHYPLIEKPVDNNYKEYSESVLDTLVLIKTVKELGFTLNEIDEFIKARGDEDASCRDLTHHQIRSNESMNKCNC